MYLSSCLGITDRPTWNLPGLKSTKEKMAASGDSPVIALPTPEWGTEPVSLKELASSSDIPNVVRIVKGHYMTIGTAKFPLTRSHQDVFIHSVKSSYKVFAHSVKIRNGGRSGRFPYSLVPLEQRMSIPVTYQGWFEILSEDGKSAKPIESIHELAKIFPEKCLVRQGIKAYLANSEGKVDRERHRTVVTGELLKLSGEVIIPAQTSKSPNGKLKLLRCIDSKGESVYFAFDQRGLFAPLAKRDGISGVHTIKDLLAKFRPPLTVKLIQGVFPKVDKSRFNGVVRLDWVYQDDTAFVCPITKESNLRMLPVPTDCPLKLVTATNIQQIKESDVYKKVMIRCNRMIANYNNTIHLIMAVPEVVMRSRRNSQMAHQMYRQSLPGAGRATPSGRMKRSKSKEDMLMDEIDDLYQYVRDGGDPPKTKFTYDSDEESYWEEPEYETLDDFRARLAAIDTGAQVPPPLKYKPLDTAEIPLNGEDNRMSNNPTPRTPPTPPPRRYSLPAPEISKQLDSSQKNESPKMNGVHSSQNGTSSASPEAVLSIDGLPKGCSSTDPPPPLPNKAYQRSGSIPALLIRKTSVDMLTPGKQINHSTPVKGRMQRSKSRDTIGTTDSNSGSSGGRIGRDWVDLSDRSVRSRDTRSSGSNGKRKMQRKMQQLYL
ncbi:uncharacterized protein LOC135470515 [Liolophura sinensis]|uniref:uncharacterized protein LOC135470515 n=1 Tax=Liolophura sinensis TaxID=3198878 RepID=UPI00315955A3